MTAIYSGAARVGRDAEVRSMAEYWPLSDSDAKRLQSACCGNGHFDGPSTHVGEGEDSNDRKLSDER